MKIKEGDVVVVDMEKVKSGNQPPFPRWGGRDKIPVTITTKNGDSIEGEYSGLRQWIHPSYIEGITICRKHGDSLYHDGREEWFCPWCEE